MKRVLITGANSFLGNNTKEYLEEHGEYQVDTVDMLDANWEKNDFSKYDVVFNVCAIVHRPEIKDSKIYFDINRDLAVKIALKSKKEGVKQFIQTSTNGVFGIEIGILSENNGYNPKTPYEKSKYEADCLLTGLRDTNFKVCIVRPPLMYGKGCKGNFPKLERFALKHHIFPSFKNKKNFIYIENMADFVKYAIDNELDEVCYPRDDLVISTSELIKGISQINGKKMYLLAVLNPLVKLFYRSTHSLKLIFGDCYYLGAACSKEWHSPFTLEDALKRMYK